MITPKTDEEALERLVGSGTFARGTGYAQAGAVRKRTWSPGGTHVVGEVQGGEAKPYVASVSLTRSRSNHLSGFRSTYTSHQNQTTAPGGPRPGRRPHGRLAAGRALPHTRRGRPGTRPGGAPGPCPPAVRRGRDRPRPPTGSSRSGLCWTPMGREPEEVATDGDRTPVRAGPDPAEQCAATARVSGSDRCCQHTGSWVRSGISWSGLDYFSFRRSVTGRDAARAHLDHGAPGSQPWPSASRLQLLGRGRLAPGHQLPPSLGPLFEARDLQYPSSTTDGHRAGRPPGGPGRGHPGRRPGRRGLESGPGWSATTTTSPWPPRS